MLHFCPPTPHPPPGLYVHKLGIPGYRKGSQFDARECISHILENCYPNEFRDQSIFKIGCNVTMECECGRHYDRDDPELILKLDTEDFIFYIKFIDHVST